MFLDRSHSKCWRKVVPIFSDANMELLLEVPKLYIFLPTSHNQWKNRGLRWRQKFISSYPSRAGFSCEKWYHYIDACCVLLSISLAARVLSWSQTLGRIGSWCWTYTVQSCCPAKNTWWTSIINEHFIWIYFLPFYYIVARPNAINEWSWFVYNVGTCEWINVRLNILFYTLIRFLL